jgi:hypothetical protein
MCPGRASRELYYFPVQGQPLDLSALGRRPELVEAEVSLDRHLAVLQIHVLPLKSSRFQRPNHLAGREEDISWVHLFGDPTNDS